VIGKKGILSVIRVHLGKLGRVDIAKPTLLELVALGVVLAAVVVLWLWR
jgi:hypothetical protein